MKVRFSVIAFVPPNAQLGVVGSPPFLGEWDVKKCLPLLPYSSPHSSGQEPSLWFRDVDVPAAAAADRAAPAPAAAANGAPAGNFAAAARGGGGGARDDAGDVAAAAAVSNREECADAGCYVLRNSSSGCPNGCSQCLGNTDSSWIYGSDDNRWLDSRCCCGCGTCLKNNSSDCCCSCCIDNACSGDSCFAAGSYSRITDTTRSVGRSSRHGAGTNFCVRGSATSSAAGGINNSCEGPEAAARAVCTTAEDPSFAAHHCAIHHTAASVGHAAGLPGGVPVAAPAAQEQVLCTSCREDDDVAGDTEFAWELLLAASHAQPRSRYAAVAAAAEGDVGNSSCCCHTEGVNGRRRLAAAAAGCRDPWKYQTFESTSRQQLQDEVDSKCEPSCLYYSSATTSSEHQHCQTGTIQAPLRRCCRRRDQTLSSVEGRGYRGAVEAGGEHSNGVFIDGATAAAEQQHQSSRGGFIDAGGVDAAPCMHAHFYREQHSTRRDPGAPGEAQTCDCDSMLWGAATYSIDPRIPAVLHLLESHSLKKVQFEYKFILWYPPSDKAALPCFPSTEGGEATAANLPGSYLYGSSGCCTTAGDERASTARGSCCGLRAPPVGATSAEDTARGRCLTNVAKLRRGWARGVQREGLVRCCLLHHRYNCGSNGANEENWREWLFPPFPPRLPSPPEAKEVLVWEGTGPEQNRKFVFDPFDVVVDLNRRGVLQCLYICKVAHFRDPRASGTGEYELTTRFYNSVRSESRMHFARICPGLYVGSCPRQLLHIRLLKEELKVTCIFNLQTEQDICNNYPDPLATARSAEDVSHLYDSQGLRYVWLPTADMRDSARRTACANAAFLLLGLVKSGHCVYVHCNAGVGRSVAAVSAFLCFAIGLDLRKVNFLICAKRPVAYWDEKAMKYGLGDYTHKFGNCTVFGDTI